MRPHRASSGGIVMSLKVRENRIRRVADRQGLALWKSRRRDQRALDFGSYRVIDRNGNYVVFGGEYGTDLDSVEAYLSEAE
jgi:hypothetical protein